MREDTTVPSWTLTFYYEGVLSRLLWQQIFSWDNFLHANQHGRYFDAVRRYSASMFSLLAPNLRACSTVQAVLSHKF
jgi:hypothetical protein